MKSELDPGYSPINEGASLLMGGGAIGMFAYTYSGWRDETDSWKKTAYLGAALMNSPIMDVKGPDVAEFFSRICVNNFSKFSAGRIRHAIICNEKGQIMTDGVVMKIAEDTYRTYWLHPVLGYLVGKFGDEYNIAFEELTGKEYFFQIAGPKSKEIISACGGDIEDLRFAHHKMIKIDGKDVRILRLGMTGNLAYEIHGPMADAIEIYNHIWETGKDAGICKLGQQAYCMNHTEGGYPNINIHYPMPWFESENLGFEGFSDYLAAMPWFAFYNNARNLAGSVGDNLDVRFVTPFDVGWGGLIRFDHEFAGRDALEKEAADPGRTVVTLEWNADDIADIYASQFRGVDVEPCDFIEDRPNDVYYFGGAKFTYHADKVLDGNRKVGISVGRGVSNWFRRMISLCFIDPKYAETGKELKLIWGSPGTPQKEIRVTVARFPYLDFDRNNETE